MASAEIGGDAASAKPAWRKVLYLRQPYEDNYVDESFLDSLVLNAHVRRYEFCPLCRGASAVVRQLCLAATVAGVWWRVQRRVWDGRTLLMLDALCMLLVLGTSCLVGLGASKQQLAADGAVQGLKVLAPLWVFAPLLQTLTKSWSDDTIAALASLLLFLHVLSYDYTGVAGGEKASSSPSSAARLADAHSIGTSSPLPGGAVALNAGVLAATILASRLETPEEVFGFMAFAMEVFAFFPRVAQELTLYRRGGSSTFASAREHSQDTAIPATLALLLLALASLLGSPLAAPLLLLLGTVLVGLVGPALFLWAQRYKNEIQGPWDIAHVSPSFGRARS